jgi:hypothetical protein
MLRAKMRKRLKKISFGGTVAHPLEEQFNGDAGSLANRLAGHHTAVPFNKVLPSHVIILAEPV